MAESDAPPPASAPDAFDMAAWRPRRSRWVLVAMLLVVLVGVVVVARLASQPKPRPHRLLVLLTTKSADGVVGSWWGRDGQASGRCADRLFDRLGALGLDVVRAGHADTLDRLSGRTSPAELREAARELEAGMVLAGAIEVVTSAELTGSDGQQEVVLELHLAVQSTQGEDQVEVGEGAVRMVQVAKTEADALLGACDQLPERVAPALAAAIVELPQLRALLAEEQGQRDLDASVVVEKLAPLRKLAEGWRAAKRRRAEQAKRLEEQDAKQERGAKKKHRLSAFLAEEYFVGAGAKDGVIVMALPTRGVLADDQGEQLQMRAEHEQLVWVGADGTERKVLLQLFNIYSYPSVSADGSAVALVVDHRQWSKALQVVSLPDGAAREITHHRSQYFSSPLISPDGSRIVFWSSQARGGERRLEIIGADGSDRRVLVAGPWEHMDLPVWAPDGRALYLCMRGLDDDGASLWRVEPEGGEPTALLGPAAQASGSPEDDSADGASRSFAQPSVSAQGDFIVVVERRDGDSWLGRYELGDGSYRRLAPVPVGRAEISPDGKWIAFETQPTKHPDDAAQGDQEIALLPAGGGAPKQLTINATKDTLAGWSRDGGRIYLHQGNRDPDGRRYDNRIYWIEP